MTTQAGLIRKALLDTGYSWVTVLDSEDTLTGLGRRATGHNLFVSLHLNAFNKKVQGTETIIWTGNPAIPDKNYDEILAQSIQKELVSSLGFRDRGVKKMRLSVLGAVPPSVEAACLVESFFIDSVGSLSEVKELTVQSATAIALGIHRYWTMNPAAQLTVK
jgi:N-acetylmuramoyl-L-alanine amidase